MKKNIIYITLIILMSCFYSCKDYLDVVPDNVARLEDAFADRTSTERFLATCYYYIPYFGRPADDIAILGSDEWWAIEDSFYGTANYYGLRIQKGYQNVSNPYFNFWDGQMNGRGTYRGIHDCNTFLENVFKVGGDLSDEDAKRWAAEVKVLKAFYHYMLLRMYGPIPLLRENIPVSAGINEVRVYRDPFDDCVDYLVSLLDEAVPFLFPEIRVDSDYGRITQAIALSIKAELLVMAARPLFNGNPDYKDIIDNRGVYLFSREPDPTKWQKAADACKEAIDASLAAGHELYKFTKYGDISDTTRLVTTLRHVVTDPWNKEIIWSEATLNMQTYHDRSNPWAVDPYMSPTLRMAELFYTNNGVPMDEDTAWVNSGRYTNRFDPEFAPEDHKYYVQTNYETAKLNLYREPRFYANLAFDGGIWFGNGRFQDVGKGNPSEQSWVFQTKRGEARGKKSNLRYSMSGYWAKKPSNVEINLNSTGVPIFTRSTYPIFRLSDLYLLYSEALNESLSAPTSEVYYYIDLVRERAGLKGVVESWQTASKYPDRPKNREDLRNIIRQERMIELAFEGKRYWDIRQWKTASYWINQPINGLNVDGYTAADFNTLRIVFNTKFLSRDYLAPIRRDNLRMNPNLVQNPGWE
jgi:hypothetical protein